MRLLAVGYRNTALTLSSVQCAVDGYAHHPVVTAVMTSPQMAIVIH